MPRHVNKTSFAKGLTPWNKGRKATPEAIENQRKAHLGYKQSPEHALKSRTARLGHVTPQETRIKQSLAQKGKPRHSEESRRKMSEARKGRRILTDEQEKYRVSRLPRGSNSPHWKGGITPINLKIRNSREYKIWRRGVFERDNFTCVWCGTHGVPFHADHIKPFALFPELRFAIDNGRTLCIPCHKTTDTFAGKTRTLH